MKVLLFLNGHEGCQTGIEDGFNFLKRIGKINELKWFYFNDYSKKNGSNKTKQSMLKLNNEFQPNLIVFFHIGNFNFDHGFLKKVKDIDSRPITVYDEGDMYGTWAKPITQQMKILIKFVDVVSIRGLGKFYQMIKKLNRKIIYTPHHNDIARFNNENFQINENRKYDIILIGNRVKPRFLSAIRRLPGAKGREEFVSFMSNNFENFKLFGNGWNHISGNQGPVDFYEQHSYYQNTWITVAYEHYPKVPHYFSNRLPMALMNGSLYVCHYQEGYEKMFPNSDFIFFFKTHNEAEDIVNYLFSLSEQELLERSKRAQEFALRQYHPNIIWTNFFDNVLGKVRK